MSDASQDADRPARRPGRDRDAEGRARNSRPRDGLGRPLPYGAPGVERQPEGIRRTPRQTLDEAQRLLDDGKPFHAHEVLEDMWKAAPEGERGLWRALAQFAVGLTHAARGNTRGAATLLERAARGLAPYGDRAPYGIDAAGLVRWAAAQGAAVEPGAVTAYHAAAEDGPSGVPGTTAGPPPPLRAPRSGH
ncbi:DUF309 domain-containing protein [Streptomyces sp. CA2R106]|uniref:DUF309 domain-containing protein n=1 Tax=Streptomyces sp. CA2R106 TaxID=3120153 RepID=UPI00300BE542